MRLWSVIVALFCFLVFSAIPVTCGAANYSVFKERPRLYFNKAKLESLRGLKGELPYSSFIRNAAVRAKGLVGNRVPNNLVRFNSNSLRRPADGLVNLAFHYVITGDRGSLLTAQALLRTFCSDQKWGDNNDIGAAHSLFAVSLAYDWLYSDLSSALRLMARDAIGYHAEIFYNHLIKKDIWWAQSRGLLQNHNYVNTAALAVAGIALYGQDSRSVKWLNGAEKNFDVVLSLLSPDGGSHEGVGYWSYGTLWLLNYYMAVAPAQGMGKVESSPFFKNTAKFRLYASLPGFKYNVDFADSPMVDYKGPAVILRCLASIFKDGHAQWLATKVEGLKRGRSSLWQDFVWINPDIKPISPDDLPTFAWFDNLGLLLSRSSWKDDGSLALFKASAPQGFLAQSKNIYAGSHIHPDEGHYGFWLGRKALVLDDGYVLKKFSISHNILTFNNIGQLGEGGIWFQNLDYKKGRGKTIRPRFKSGDKFQAVEAELSGYYPISVRPKSWKRTVIVIGGSEMIIRDKVVPSGNVEVRYPIHVTRKARKFGDGLCLDYGNGYALNLDNGGADLSLKRYSILTKSMGKDIPRGGMNYLSTMSGAVPFSMLTIIGQPVNGCAENKMVEKYNRAQDTAVIVCKSGRFKINFSTLTVNEI